MGTCCCATVDIKNMLAVSGHVPVSRDTCLCDPHDVTRSFASALYCGVTATCLRARGALLDESQPLSTSPLLQAEPTVTQSTNCCSYKGAKLSVTMNQAPSKESVVEFCTRRVPTFSMSSFTDCFMTFCIAALYTRTMCVKRLDESKQPTQA